jgi:hypothetical protein
MHKRSNPTAAKDPELAAMTPAPAAAATNTSAAASANLKPPRPDRRERLDAVKGPSSREKSAGVNAYFHLDSNAFADMVE